MKRMILGLAALIAAIGARAQDPWYAQDFSVSYVKYAYSGNNARNESLDKTITVSRKGNELYIHMESLMGPTDATYVFENGQVLYYKLDARKHEASKSVKGGTYADATSALKAQMKRDEVLASLFQEYPKPDPKQATVKFLGRDAYEVTRSKTISAGSVTSTSSSHFVVDKETGAVLKSRTAMSGSSSNFDKVMFECQTFNPTTPDYSKNVTSLAGYTVK